MGRFIKQAALVVGVALISSLVAVGAVRAAGPQLFDDVPPTDPFAESIYGLAGDCITGGYEDGTFRPLDPVTRRAMAAFLYRTVSRASSEVLINGPNPAVGSPAAGVSSQWKTIAETRVWSVNLPASCDVAVSIHGSVSLFSNATRAGTCWDVTACEVEVGIFYNSALVESATTRVSGDHWGDNVSLATVVDQADDALGLIELKVRATDVRSNKVVIGTDRSLVGSSNPGRAETSK